MNEVSLETGRWIAELLSGSWRERTSTLALPLGVLGQSDRFLLQAGVASLAWRRLSETPAANARAGRFLKDAARLQKLQARTFALQLRELALCLQPCLEDILLVGGAWTNRRYPDPALRPNRDIDLVIAPESRRRVAARLHELGGACGVIDLHDAADSRDRSWRQLCQSSRPVDLGGVHLRATGPEDQLRHLAFSLHRRPFWYPLWLVDLAVLLDTLPREFDWKYWQSGAATITRSALNALGLACDLLRPAIPASLPAEGRSAPAPLRSAVLEQWGRAIQRAPFPRRWFERRSA